eukprot:TRINITY_DN29037_c0_g1_i1.p1 TRINITY_DN29037_c0_g1~~TRINITY_DN29037_c0_g1_i1.p1  ORF type:complete len:418 (-),score=39.95 TRINITY_DN29037_c0_g1_i1:347-1600(-)
MRNMGFSIHEVQSRRARWLWVDLQNQLERGNEEVQRLSADLDQTLVEKRQLEHQLAESQIDCKQRLEMEDQIRQLKETLSHERGKHKTGMKEITQEAQNQINNVQQQLNKVQQQLKQQCEQCDYYKVMLEEAQEQMLEESSAKEQQLMSLAADLRESQRAQQDLEQEINQSTNFKGKYDNLLKEREKFLVKIQDLQLGTDKALARADSEEKKAKVLQDQTNSLRQQVEGLQSQTIELQNELGILSGQQNVSQRIHHLKKVKDENNDLKVKYQNSQDFISKQQRKIERLSEELLRLRPGQDGQQQMDLDEEFLLRDEILRVETELMKIKREFQHLTNSLMEIAQAQCVQGEEENTPPCNIVDGSPCKQNVDSMEFEDLRQVAQLTVYNIKQLLQKSQQKLWLSEEKVNLLQLQCGSQR